MKLVNFEIELQAEDNIADDEINAILQTLASRVSTVVQETADEMDVGLKLDY